MVKVSWRENHRIMTEARDHWVKEAEKWRVNYEAMLMERDGSNAKADLLQAKLSVRDSVMREQEEEIKALKDALLEMSKIAATCYQAERHATRKWTLHRCDKGAN